MSLEEAIKKYINEGYELDYARSKVAQDVILNKISKSKFKKHITIKGGVVMHNISNSIRRSTRDIDLDFIKYSLKDESIKAFIESLSIVEDGIDLIITNTIEELHHQDYNGKRVYVQLIDNKKYKIETKLDIGVHKLFQLEQDKYYFALDTMETGVSLLINSCEQIFTEKLKSLLIFGIRSGRYKDIFDFYYLIKNNKLNKNKLLNTFKFLIFQDEKMREKTLDDIYLRLKSIFDSKTYKSNLENPKNNWLDVTTDDVVKLVLEYILKLSNKVIEVNGG